MRCRPGSSHASVDDPGIFAAPWEAFGASFPIIVEELIPCSEGGADSGLVLLESPYCLSVTFRSGLDFQLVKAERSSSQTRLRSLQGEFKMEVHISQLEGVRFSAQARTHTVLCDQPQDNGGTDAGMTPPEFLLVSLGTCAAFYAAEYLRTRNLAHSGVSVSVSADKLKGPARLGNFRIRVDSPVPLSSEQREALMRSVEHCLVKSTLLSPPQIEILLNVPAAAEVGI